MTTGIVIITAVISLYAFSNQSLYRRFLFNPYLIRNKREWYRFFTSGFIHADIMHLFVNMFVLYSFGTIAENYFDNVFSEKANAYFLMLYIGGLAFSVLPTFKQHADNPMYNGLGASGAVAGVLYSFILFDPMDKICLYGLLCMPGVIFALLYLIVSYFLNKKGGDNVNHNAHMWGAIFGFCFTLFLKPSLLIDFFQKLIYFGHAI